MHEKAEQQLSRIAGLIQFGVDGTFRSQIVPKGRQQSLGLLKQDKVIGRR
ncbi:hypothetical protein [Mangrovitalea sediminis]|nr:hypothetical protein [Mangrovitalea sediminis]